LTYGDVISIYSIKCQDGTDRQCDKTLSIDIAINNLSSEQILNIIEDGGCGKDIDKRIEQEAYRKHKEEINGKRPNVRKSR